MAEESALYMIDIVVKPVGIIDDHTTSLSLEELMVFGIPGSDEGKSFELVMASPGCWKVEGSIELFSEVEGIDLVVRGTDNEDLGLVHVDIPNMRTTKMHSDNGLGERVEIFGTEVQLAISWELVEIPPDTAVGVGESASALYGREGADRLRRFLQAGNLSDINEAVSTLERAVEIAPQGHADLPRYLNNLGLSFRSRFERTGQLSDISEAVSAQQKAVTLTPDGHADLLGRLTSLGDTFVCRFERTGKLSDVSEAIFLHQRAVRHTPEGHVDLPIRLSSLGISLMGRFKRTGKLSDLAEAASALRSAVKLTPGDHADLPIHLGNLGSYFIYCFTRTGQVSDIAEAISALRRAVELTPEDGDELPCLLTNLGISLTKGFEWTGKLSVISEAVSVQRRAVYLTPEGHADMPGYLSNLGVTLTNRFERSGHLSDISEAVAVHQRAVELAPDNHVTLPFYLSRLGNSFIRRFERSGQLSDISEAVSAHQKAGHIIPEGHADLPGHLSNLGMSLACRFGRTGNISDISEAVSVQQRAVELTPQGHAEMPSYLSNLGIALANRFERSGQLSDISEAVSVHQRAVYLAPDGHVTLPFYLTNLGISLRTRFERTQKLSDISGAVAVQKRAVDLTPEDRADLPSYLTNLGNSLICRFEHTARLSDISEAISVHKRAVDLASEGHPSPPDYFGNLGTALHLRFVSGADTEDLDASISCFRAAAVSFLGSPDTKLAAARRWAQLLIEHYPQSPEIVPSISTALDLVALVAGLEKTVEGRYTQLQSISGLALEGGAAACFLGMADKALEWLEQGRCLVWNQLNNLRTPLDDLRIHDKELAENIADIAKQLENAGSTGSSRGTTRISRTLSETMLRENEGRAHLGLAAQWEHLLKTTRAIPGFESFLMPPPCSTLLHHLPQSGPIIVVNVDKRRCDALALLHGLDEPLHIPLPNFSLVKANRYRANLTSHLQSQHLWVREEDLVVIPDGEFQERGVKVGRRGKEVEDVLSNLWKEVVKPILEGLGFSRAHLTPGELLPRIWWCPTGPLSFLPLHAAGIYRGPNADSIFDYVVSSYTPTVSAITDRVQKSHHPVEKIISGVFLTSQPNTPGASPITGTTREVRSIFERAQANGVRVLKVEGSELTVDSCLEHMREYSCIHLACHGSQNAAQPLQSRFLLHTGALDLGVVLQSNLKNADLAFLSACQTSTGDEKISDEVVHLAAGMLAAGYRRVVATMWSIGDQAAQEVATDFYDYIFSHREDGSGTMFDGSLSAYALHHAVQRLRQRVGVSESSLLTWVPFVHFGY
ncbi:CHAT domain-containing protein [Ephemerocybe angulata]|uniref:CHAT domain-containing protein n=1 Tax=Ephemerocybe angulata TaxID=980116 RepID=A0A8H6HVT6_9AGAR|nr:CHAT domain-containing protein [Tulosesus angulatus]